MITADIPQRPDICRELLLGVAEEGEFAAGPKFKAGKGLVAFVESLDPDDCVKVLCLAFLAKKNEAGGLR